MKLSKYLALFFTITLLGSVLYFWINPHRPYSKSLVVKYELEKLSKQQRIQDRYEQELEMTMDPVTGKIPYEAKQIARQQTQKQIAVQQQKAAIPNVQWSELGPNNIGGRTRALMFDPTDNTNKKMYAGSVGGGLWYSNDITASSANWQKIDDFWDNLAVTSMDHDPVNTSNFYVGTGEGFYNADAIRGEGVWKSFDAGITWSQLSSTSSWRYVNKLICPSANTIIVAEHSALRRSTDGGSSWSNVRSGRYADVEMAANGDLYASNFSGDVFKSTDNGASWSEVYNAGSARIEIATAPSNANVVYILENISSQVGNIAKTTNGGASWSNVSVPNYLNQGSAPCSSSTQSFARGQAWYDMIALVNEQDHDKIIVGGIDLWRSEDGGTTWGSISYWTGACDAYLHADQHALVTRPGFPDQIVSGNDGGVAYSSNAFTTGSNPTYNIQNENYNVTQFYAVAVHPTTGTHNYLVGSQDNGTKRLTSNNIGGGSGVSGGDGAFCHIDQDQPNYQISSYVYNNYYISTNGSSFPGYFIANTGRFINPTDYDNETNKLYCASSSGKYLIVEGIGSSLSNQEITTNQFGGTVSAVRVSPNVSNRVYFGVNGKIWRVDNASTSPSYTDLGTPTNGYVSSICIEDGDEDHILVTYSNYNVSSVFESSNGGNSWNNREGDLPNMPVRWGIFNPGNFGQAILATEMGVWTTDLLSASNVDWEPTNSGLANVRVDMLEYRSSDNTVVAATHGRGAYLSTSFNSSCAIQNVIIGDQMCDATSSTYSQDLEIELQNTPSSGTIDINGQSFSFPTDAPYATINVTLVDLVADGQAVDLNIVFSSNNACSVNIVDAFQSPESNCVQDNLTCTFASEVTSSGTYTANGPADGNGCHNCSSASHADWYKFTAPSDGLISIASCGSGVDTRFWLYVGDCNNLQSVANSDDNCTMGSGLPAYASEVVDIDVTAGNTYFIEWDNRWSSSGFDWEFTYNSSGGCPVGTNKLFVDVLANGDDTGCSWTNAVPNLQDAINIAATNNEITELWVKSGTYYPGISSATTTRTSTFTVSNDLVIYGGFDGTENELSERDFTNNNTILSGDFNNTASVDDDAYHILTHSGTNSLTLDGIILEKANANLGVNDCGAGILNTGTITVENCTFQQLISVDEGCAIHNSLNTSSIMLKNNNFSNNSLVDVVNGISGNMIIGANTNNSVN